MPHPVFCFSDTHHHHYNHPSSLRSSFWNGEESLRPPPASLHYHEKEVANQRTRRSGRNTEGVAMAPSTWTSTLPRLHREVTRMDVGAGGVCVCVCIRACKRRSPRALRSTFWRQNRTDSFTRQHTRMCRSPLRASLGARHASLRSSPLEAVRDAPEPSRSLPHLFISRSTSSSPSPLRIRAARQHTNAVSWMHVRAVPS